MSADISHAKRLSGISPPISTNKTSPAHGPPALVSNIQTIHHEPTLMQKQHIQQSNSQAQYHASHAQPYLLHPSQTHIRQNINNSLQHLIQNRQRPPVQMVSPVQQVVSAQELQQIQSRQERFIFLDGGPIVGGNYQGINTQVVAANQGLRMAALQPELRMQRPALNGQSKNMGNIPPNNINNFYQQKLTNVQRPPSANITWQQQQQRLMPVAPSIQKPNPTLPPIKSNQPHVPNIALPYSPLPKLKASISATGSGIILTWDYDTTDNTEKFKVECYHLFAHQAKDTRVNPPPDITQWKKIGVVNALPLPMACTLTQFATGNVYHFAVLAVDIHGREGEMSNPCIIRLNLNS